MSREKLSQIVTRVISKNQCPVHHQPLIFYSSNQSALVCQLCKISDSISLTQLVQNPIKILLNFEQSSPFVYSTYRQLKSHEKVSKTLKILMNEIKEKVSQYCDLIVNEYHEKWEQAHKNSVQNVDKIADVENRYRFEFQSLLQNGFNHGKVEELEEVIRTFRERSEDPSSFIQKNILQVRECIQDVPFINWTQLKDLYTKVCDPFVWDKSKFYQSKDIIQNEDVITFGQDDREVKGQIFSPTDITKDLLPNMNNQLRDPSYALFFNDELTKLIKIQKGNQQFSSINQDSLCSEISQALKPLQQHILNDVNDSYCELGQYYILGIRYEKLTLYSYQTGQLIKRDVFQIRGCTSVLAFKECLIVLAGGRLWRIWLEDGFQEVLGTGEGQLWYCGQNGFGYKTVEGRQMYRYAYHNGKPKVLNNQQSEGLEFQ